MGWPQNAYVGQKVVCIDNSTVPNPWHNKHPLVLNEVYTILAIDVLPRLNIIHFQIDNSMRLWSYDKFKPVQSTESGMKVLNAILKNVDAPVKEKA